jgi:hypothetical protein
MDMQGGDAMGSTMRLTAFLGIAALACAVQVSAQGQIGTIERGQYTCELPGDASGAAGIHQPQEDFRIASASRYRADDGDGTYLRRGDVMTMTSGPRNGAQYAVISPNFLRKLDNGEPGRLRCVRRDR